MSSARYGIASHETNLVLQCVRAFLSGGNDDSVQAALAQHLDWSEVRNKAIYHSVLPLVACTLKKHSVPPEIGERLQKQLDVTARKNMVWLAEWHQILRTFEAAEIPVISLKGPGFALQAYGNIALREFTDLDLLVHPENVSRARDALLREGYRLRFSLPVNADHAVPRIRNRQLDFVNEGRGTILDLHWAAMHGMFSFQLPVDQLFLAAQVEHQEDIRFLSLSREHLLLYLCAHGTKHCWLNLRWLCDVVCHVKTARALDWKACIRWAEETNCDLVLKHSMLLAQQVLGLELPSAIRDYCDSTEARRLADTASTLLFREEGHLGYGEALHYHLGFTKGWNDRLRLVFERVFVPAEPDWQEVHLPRPLHLLYYAVRPARFALGQWALRR